MAPTPKTYVQLLEEAHCLANRKGLFFINRGGEFIVYRRTDWANVRLGRRSTVNGLTRFLKQCGHSNEAIDVGERNDD